MMTNDERKFGRRAVLATATTALAAAPAILTPGPAWADTGQDGRSASGGGTANRQAGDLAATDPVELFHVNAGASDPDDGRRGFDFLHGRWSIKGRSIGKASTKEQPNPQVAWVEWTGIMECRPILGGLGNVDDNLIRRPKGVLHGSTYRLFNPEKKSWSLWWVNDPAPLLIPTGAPANYNGIEGNFHDGVGLFYAYDPSDQSTVRYKWHRITPQSARYELAYSFDDRQSWIDQTIWEFTRRA